MTVDPRWSFFLSLFIAILNFLAGSTTQWTAMGLDTHGGAVLAVVTLLTGILSLINTALAAIPSKGGKGYFVAPPPEPPKP